MSLDCRRIKQWSTYKLRPRVCRKISVFRESRKSKIFNGRKSSETKLSLFRFRLLRKLTENLTETPENVKNVKNYTGIFKNRQPLPKIPVHFRHFRHIPIHFWWKMVEMALKMVENHENYTGIFDSYRKCRTFDVLTTVENVPNYSSFDFWLSRYIFTKLLEFPKALSKRMALV